MRDAPFVTLERVDDDMAHYRAATALDEILAWFVSDGYTRTELEDLVMGHVDDAMEGKR